MHFAISDSWDSYLDLFPRERRDIYYHEDYLRLYETGDGKALCLICIDGDSMMLMPFIRRTVGGGYDYESAYGYGGPITNSDDPDWTRNAYMAIHDYMKDEGYICGLTRFHPLLDNYLIPEDYSSDVLFDRHTIAIDTSSAPEEIWSQQISSKCRNMIRKAEKNGLEYIVDREYAYLDEFMRLYFETMDRLNADRFYYFDREYFDAVQRDLRDNSFLGIVKKDGQVICGAIFLYSDCYGHYHLQGSDRRYSGMAAGNYLLWKVACTMHDMGIVLFHLGGGTSGQEDDPLYKFKAAFGREIRDFYIGKEIYDTPAYESLCEEWMSRNPGLIDRYGHYLLKYRYGEQTKQYV